MKKVYSKSYRANGSTNIDENREFQSLKATGAYYARAESHNYNMTNTSSQYGSAIGFDASKVSKIYKNNHKEVTPYNFNINLLVKI